MLMQKRKRKPNTPYDPVDHDVRKKSPASSIGSSNLEDAKIVVAIDFGTTFSGYAYILKSEPDRIYTFQEWPCQGEAQARSYSKTQTSLWYLLGEHGTLHLEDWGWQAQVNYANALQDARNYNNKGSLNSGKQMPTGHFLTKFKLHLSPDEVKRERLPHGLSFEKATSDYLRGMSQIIMADLRNRYGSFIQIKDIKWCLTVPTIWTDAAKQKMKDCMEMAGLVSGRLCPPGEDASLHKMDIVLEPEAASIYCQQRLKQFHLRNGSKYLVVDAGGGTVDLVVHEKVNDSGLGTKELTKGSGCLCGGTFVDEAFMKYLSKNIDCFDKFSVQHPTTVITIKSKWEMLKCSFDGERDRFYIELPAKLSRTWQEHDLRFGCPAKSSYDELVITREDMKSFFDKEVTEILNKIKGQLDEVPGMDAILVVGGFSNSPYLMKKIRDKFSTQVKQILSPPAPETAVVQGAAVFGALGADIMLSRKLRKTYGISMIREFRNGDPPDAVFKGHNGEKLCKGTFCAFAKIGDDIPVDHRVTYNFYSFQPGEAEIKFAMYCTSNPNPAFVTDPGVVKVGSWSYKLPPEVRDWDMEQEKPTVEVTMYFGRTHVEMSAQAPEHWGRGKTSMFSVELEKDLV